MRSNDDIISDKTNDQTGAQATNQTPDPTYVRAKVPVAEAARLLGVSAEAVRSRIAKVTLDSVKESGKVFVLLDRAQTAQTRHNGAQTTDSPTNLTANSSATKQTSGCSWTA